MERGSNSCLGTITSHDVLDLMVLMNEIEDEAQQQQLDTDRDWGSTAKLMLERDGYRPTMCGIEGGLVGEGGIALLLHWVAGIDAGVCHVVD